MGIGLFRNSEVPLLNSWNVSGFATFQTLRNSLQLRHIRLETEQRNSFVAQHRLPIVVLLPLGALDIRPDILVDLVSRIGARHEERKWQMRIVLVLDGVTDRTTHHEIPREREMAHIQCREPALRKCVRNLFHGCGG